MNPQNIPPVGVTPVKPRFALADRYRWSKFKREFLPHWKTLFSLTLACTMPGLAMAAGSNASDRIDFGNPTSEAAHNFNPGRPPLATGIGALGQTYRAPLHEAPNDTPVTGSDQELAFTVTVDPAKQNYLTVRVWGSDTAGGYIHFKGYMGPDAGSVMASYTSAFPNRFYYGTSAIPLAMTQGKSSIQMVLYETGFGGGVGRPIYSAYTHTDPYFLPDGNDPTGAQIAQVGQLPNRSLTKAEICATLQAKRQNIFGAGGYYEGMVSRQVVPGTAGAPPEVIGLDIFGPVANFGGTSRSYDDWRNACGSASRGPGYSTIPDEMLSVFTAAYFLAPFTDVNDNVVAGLDHYHDATIIQKIVNCLDGTSRMQASDGHYQNLPNAVWAGVTSTPRANGPYAGSSARAPGWSLSLEGADTDAMGRAIIQLLNDSTAAPIFKNYLGQSVDADVNGGSMLRAKMYERMLNNSNAFLNSIFGIGTESQGLLNMNSVYINGIALAKLQALYPYGSTDSTFPGSSYTYAYPYLTPAKAANLVQQITGVLPATSDMGGGYVPNITNYLITAGGFGEVKGLLSCGYDGRYGTILPWITNNLATYAAFDPQVNSTVLASIRTQARRASEGYLHFIYPNEGYNGVTNKFTLAQEDFITYRDPYQTNANCYGFTVAAGYPGSDPGLGINSPLQRRGAYLEVLYGVQPGDGKGGNSQTLYLATVASYEASLRSLIGVDPATLTMLPGEPGAPNSAYVDAQSGTTAIYYNGERLLMNNGYRNTDFAGGQLGFASYVSRIHHTTSTIDRAVASVIMPHDSATVQSDGNLCGTLGQKWVMRYGPWLVAGNPTASAVTITLPSGSGVARDLVSGNSYNMGSSISLPAGGSLAINMPIAAASQQIANGTYVLTNISSKLLLDCPNGAATSGLQIDQAALPASTKTQWVFTSNGSGYYTVKNVASGLYLTGPTSSGSALVQQSASGQPNQNWQLISSGGGYMLANQSNALVVNNPGASPNPGTGMIVWTQDAGSNSFWSFQAVGGVANQPLSNGTYTVTNSSTYQLLTNPGSSTTSGQAMTAGSPTGGAEQKWIFTANGNGFYTIKNSVSGLCLAPVNQSADFYYPQVLQKTVDGSDLQLWAMVPTGRGYSFVNKSTLDMMAINGSVLMDRPHGGDNFCWLINAPVAQAAPVVSSGASASGSTGNAFSYQIAASNSPTSFGATGLPAGLEVSGSTGTISGVPTVGGVYNVTVTASNTNGTGSKAVSITVATVLNGTFLAQDVGSVGIAGSGSYQNGVYTLNGSGADIGGTADGCQYASQALSGDCTIIARIASQSANSSNKSGVMIRESLAANARYVNVMIQRGVAMNMEYRAATGGSAASAGAYSGIAAPYWTKLTRVGNVFTGFMSPDGVTWTQVGQVTVTMSSNIYVGLGQSAHDNGVLSTGTFDNIGVTAVPSPWLSADIGSVGLGGSAIYSSGNGGGFTVSGSGGDIWNSADAFRYVYQPSSGDCSIVARVASQGGNSNPKSGVMIRETTAANSIHVDMVIQRTSGSKMEYRSSTGGGSGSAGSSGGGAPYWVKLTRVGNVFTGYTSSDGTTWTQIGQVTITMASNALIGLPQCSSDNAQLNTATFDNVTAVP